MVKELDDEHWSEIITPKNKLLGFDLTDIWKHRYLIYLLIKRDIVAGYKQTILGPLWYVIQPIITTVTFTVIFGTIARISTDGLPTIVFYMLGVVLWGYFSSCINRTAGTLQSNAGIFGKVYFPRLIVPVASVLSTLFFSTIQFGLFLAIWLYFLIIKPGLIHPNLAILWMPYLLLVMSVLSMGIGIIISSVTVKFRDFNFLLSYLIQLWMYCSPVIYPSSEIKGMVGNNQLVLFINKFNPVTSLIETARYGFLGKGQYDITGILYSSVIAAIVLFFGMIIFNQAEKNFIDTV